MVMAFSWEKIVRRRRKLLLDGVYVLFALLLLTTTVVQRRFTPEKAVKSFLRTSSSFENRVKSIADGNFDVKENPATQLRRYEERLSGLRTDCSNVDSLLTLVQQKRPVIDKRTEDIMASTVLYCQELRPLITYQSTLYDSVATYLEADAQNISVKELISLIDDTISNLSNVPAADLSDPRPDEMAGLLKQIREQLAPLNSDDLNARSAQVVEKSQQDLLNHRITFWNNLVGISNLEIALADNINEVCGKLPAGKWQLRECKIRR